jgi:drug/metabolite transporter (DMT)-like permease
MNATPPLTARPADVALQRNWLPPLLIVLGMTLLPGMDAIAKSLAGLAAVSTISLFRNLTQVVLMAPLAWRDTHGSTGGGKLWPLANARLHILRGAFMVSTGMLFFAAVQLMPLADTLAISFIYPFIVALLSPLVVKEHLSRAQLACVLLGFVGVLVIVRPGSGVFGPAALLPVLSAFGYAAYVLVTRLLARQDAPTSVLQFWMGVFGCLWVLPVFGFAALFDYAPLGFFVSDAGAIGKIIAMGLFGTLGHWLITSGARHVSASVQAGLGYAEIITATLLGWIFWRDFPDIWSWVGIAIIIGSGIWLLKLQASPGKATGQT